MCTVSAHGKISALAPDNNLNTVFNILKGTDMVEMYATALLFTVAMSEGYVDHMRWEAPEMELRPLTVDEMQVLTTAEFDALFTEAFEAFTRDLGVTVEAEPPKVKGKNAAAAKGKKSS